MNRLEAVAGAMMVALLAAGAAQKHRELSRLAQTPAPERDVRDETIQTELRPVRSADAAIAAYVAAAESASPQERLAHLGGLLAALESPELEEGELEPKLGERLVTLIAETLASPGIADEALQRRAAAYLAARVPGKTSREFVFRALDEVPGPARLDILEKLGSPKGVRGAAVYGKVQELASKGQVPDELLPQLLRRTGGLKAKDALLTLLSGADGAKLISGCAISLQDYRDPELLGPVLERLEQVGMLDGGGRMPWVSPALLDEHLKTADRPRFRRGMMALAARPALVKTGLAHAERGLQSQDADSRRFAAIAVKQAVLGRLIDAKKGEELLAGRLQVETEPVLKAELTGGLERVRSLLEQKETGIQ